MHRLLFVPELEGLLIVVGVVDEPELSILLVLREHLVSAPVGVVVELLGEVNVVQQEVTHLGRQVVQVRDGVEQVLLRLHLLLKYICSFSFVDNNPFLTLLLGTLFYVMFCIAIVYLSSLSLYFQNQNLRVWCGISAIDIS